MDAHIRVNLVQYLESKYILLKKEENEHDLRYDIYPDHIKFRLQDILTEKIMLSAFIKELSK